VSWSRSGEYLQYVLSFYRSQGIFPGSATAADNNRVVGGLNWTGNRQSVRVSAAYGLSRQAGSGSGEPETRTRNVSAGYNRAMRRLAWSVAINHNRQSSETEFAQAVDGTSVAASLSWRLSQAGEL
jgi:hypothetical protein